MARPLKKPLTQEKIEELQRLAQTCEKHYGEKRFACVLAHGMRDALRDRDAATLRQLVEITDEWGAGEWQQVLPLAE